MNFEEFFKHYIIALLWSTSDTDSEGEELFLDSCYSIDDIDGKDLQKMEEEARKFFDENKHMFLYKEYTFRDGSYTGEQLAGHDFALTRNHHGAGFWDGDYEEDVGEKLTNISKKFPEVYPVVGNKGKIYFE